MPRSEENRRIWRTWKLPTAPASTNSNTNSKPLRAEVEHKGNPNYFPPVGDQDGQHFVHRLLTPRTPAARPSYPITTSYDEARPPPSGQSKRGADDFPSAVEPPAKKPANRSIKTPLMPADVASSRPGKTDPVTFSSLTVQKHCQPAGGMTDDASDMSESPPCETRRQPPVWGMDPFQTKYEKKPESTSDPLTAVASPQSRIEPKDDRAHGTEQTFKVDLGTRVSGSQCGACGSQRHSTKDCHVPLKHGRVCICPFHNCSELNKTDPQRHYLDGLAGRHQDGWCTLMMRYELAVRARDRKRMRYMLPQMFGEFVLNRKRKPFCKVVNLEVCPINIAIEFSHEFCQGTMPSGLEKAWPYTRSDTKKREIRDKLNHYDELGWEAMPPGELEAKSWEQIKREYAQGIIEPQICKYSNAEARRLQIEWEKLAAAELAAQRIVERRPDAELEAKPVGKKLSDGEEDTEEENPLPNHKATTALMEEMLRLSAKVDNMAETLNALRGNQSSKEPKAEPGYMAQGTWSDPIDVDTEGISIG